MEKQPQKKWTTLGSINSGGKADNLNLRDFAHEINYIEPSLTPAKDFVNKWKGFLNEEDIKDAKSNYLSDKYL